MVVWVPLDRVRLARSQAVRRRRRARGSPDKSFCLVVSKNLWPSELSVAPYLGLALELLLEVLQKVGVEILATQVSVTSSSLDSEDTTLDVEERHIEGTSTEIVDKDVALLVRLASTETVGDSSSSWLVDDTENVESGDGTGVLGGLTLVVVEVSWHSDDSLLDLLAELGLSNFLHLRTVSLGLSASVAFAYH